MQVEMHYSNACQSCLAGVWSILCCAESYARGKSNLYLLSIKAALSLSMASARSRGAWKRTKFKVEIFRLLALLMEPVLIAWLAGYVVRWFLTLHQLDVRWLRPLAAVYVKRHAFLRRSGRL